jgi:hypothetical protein
MFKKALLLTIPTLFFFSLLMAQKVDSSRFKNKDVITASLNDKESIQAKNTKNKDSVIIKTKDSLTNKNNNLQAIKRNDSTIINDKNKLINKKDSNLIKDKTALINKKDSVLLMPKIELKLQQMDSVWLKSGDTLIGQIKLDKDKNALLFTKDTLIDVEMKPSDVLRMTVFPKNRDDERMDVFNIFNEYYFLETSPNALLKIYTNKTFKAIINDGPKHFIVQNKYCLFKNDTPYFLDNGRAKDVLIFLMNDCKRVKDAIKSGKYNKNNFIEAVMQYNRCNE